jgi:PleD family two-component response regulator
MMDSENPGDRKKVILAIDDILVNLRTVRNALDKYYEVKVVKSGEQALLVLASIQVDLILLDIEMPGLSGFDILKTIKNIPSTKDIPVIFVSSHVSIDLIADAIKNGAVDYIAKPFDSGVLVKKVFTALKTAGSRINEMDDLPLLPEDLGD